MNITIYKNSKYFSHSSTRSILNQPTKPYWKKYFKKINYFSDKRNQKFVQFYWIKLTNLKPSLSGRRASWIDQRVKIQTRKFSIKVSFTFKFTLLYFFFLMNIYIFGYNFWYLKKKVILFCHCYLLLINYLTKYKFFWLPKRKAKENANRKFNFIWNC